MNYLTTQDVLWIHSQIDRWPQHFDVMALEEAIGYQYVYGRQGDVLASAGRFLEGLLQRKPFAERNDETAFASVQCLLVMNGYELAKPDIDVEQMLSSIAAGRDPSDALLGVCAGKRIAQDTGGRRLEPGDLRAVRASVRA